MPKPRKREPHKSGSWWNPTGDQREYFNNRLRGWVLVLAAIAAVIGIVVHETRDVGDADNDPTARDEVWRKPTWR